MDGEIGGILIEFALCQCFHRGWAR